MPGTSIAAGHLENHMRRQIKHPAPAFHGLLCLSRQAKEDAEAAKWLGQISTEQEGTDALDSEEQQVSKH